MNRYHYEIFLARKSSSLERATPFFQAQGMIGTWFFGGGVRSQPPAPRERVKKV